MAEELAKLNFETRSSMEAVLLLMGFTEKLHNGRFSMWTRPVVGKRLRKKGSLIVKVYIRRSKITETKLSSFGATEGTLVCQGYHDEVLEYLKERIDEAKGQAEGRA